MHQLRPGPGNLRPFESKTFDGSMLHKVEENRFSVRFQLQGPQGPTWLEIDPSAKLISWSRVVCARSVLMVPLNSHAAVLALDLKYKWEDEFSQLMETVNLLVFLFPVAPVDLKQPACITSGCSAPCGWSLSSHAMGKLCGALLLLLRLLPCETQARVHK